MTKKTRRAKARRALLTLSLVLVSMMVAVGGTIAYLTDSTNAITNTFTVGKVDIDLTETDFDEDGNPLKNSYKMIPGDTIFDKDPTVIVKAESEASYLLVKVTKSANYDTYLDNFTVADGWESVADGDKDDNTIVYCKKVDSTIGKAEARYPLFKENTGIKVKETMKTVTGDDPTLTFVAAAVQASNIADNAAAFAQVKTLLGYAE